MTDRLEERPDAQINNPVVLPAPLRRCPAGGFTVPQKSFRDSPPVPLPAVSLGSRPASGPVSLPVPRFWHLTWHLGGRVLARAESSAARSKLRCRSAPTRNASRVKLGCYQVTAQWDSRHQEQRTAPSHIDQRADVYGATALIYWLLTGQLPDPDNAFDPPTLPDPSVRTTGVPE